MTGISELRPTSDNGAAGHPGEVLAEAAAGAQPRRLGRNEVLFDQGDPATELFVIQTGRVAVLYRAQDGRESVVALMTAGDVLGLVGLFDGRDRRAQARALEPSSVLALPYPRVRRMLEQHPTLLWSVGKVLTSRLRAAGDALADSAFLDLPGRTAKRLLELAGDADEFQLPLTQEELAAMVGGSRERVNKAIASFVRLGWLEQQDRHYRIRDREQLANRARG